MRTGGPGHLRLHTGPLVLDGLIRLVSSLLGGAIAAKPARSAINRFRERANRCELPRLRS